MLFFLSLQIASGRHFVAETSRFARNECGMRITCSPKSQKTLLWGRGCDRFKTKRVVVDLSNTHSATHCSHRWTSDIPCYNVSSREEISFKRRTNIPHPLLFPLRGLHCKNELPASSRGRARVFYNYYTPQTTLIAWTLKVALAKWEMNEKN